MAILKHIKSIGYLISTLLFLYLLNPFNLNNFFAYLLVVIIVSKKQFLLRNLDINFFLLLIFSFVYAIFYSFEPSGGNQFIFVYATFPVTFYLLGKYIHERLEGNSYPIYYFLFATGAIYSATPLISVLLNIAEGGFGQIDRSLPLFWDGRLLAATIMGSYFVFNMCIPALLVVQHNTLNLKFKILAMLLFVLSLACMLRIGSRTQISIFIIVLFCSLIYIIPKQSIRRNIFIFSVFGLGLFLLISNVSFDLNQDWLSTFAGRMEKGGVKDIASGGGRTERWVRSVENIFKKPLGWNSEEFGHSHNLWLDVLRVSGIISFLILIIFSIKSFFGIKHAVRKNKFNYVLNNQLILYSLAFFLVFMVEPIFEGMFSLFVLFCLFMGIITKYRTTRLVNL